MEFELFLAIVLVVLVIFIFLRSVSATIISAVSVPLSLVGTLALMYVLGYSLDNLSLMALTISTGFVVDDAIVMIENISRYVEQGDPPMEAALKEPTDWFYDHVADHRPHGSADSAAVHGRCGGTAVPRIRGDPGGDDRFLGRGIADPHTDDERPHPQAK